MKNGFPQPYTSETGDLTIVDVKDSTVLYFGDEVADSVEYAESVGKFGPEALSLIKAVTYRVSNATLSVVHSWRILDQYPKLANTGWNFFTLSAGNINFALNCDSRFQAKKQMQ